MSGPAVLAVRLEGPLQAWGDRARWSVRDTRRFPTKSGVVGLLACALGWGPGESDAIAELAAELRLAVRADRPGTVIRDFHTVEGGVLQADAKYRHKLKRTASTGLPETVTSDRQYLSDALFLALLAGPPARLARLAEHLARPVWPLFLGRRSCPPSAPLVPALPKAELVAPLPTVDGDPLRAAIERYPWLDARGGASQGPLAYELELPPGAAAEGTRSWRRDAPLRQRPRTFDLRAVDRHTCTPPAERS